MISSAQKVENFSLNCRTSDEEIKKENVAPSHLVYKISNSLSWGKHNLYWACVIKMVVLFVLKLHDLFFFYLWKNFIGIHVL